MKKDHYNESRLINIYSIDLKKILYIIVKKIFLKGGLMAASTSSPSLSIDNFEILDRGKNKAILVVEDEKISQVLIKTLLRSWAKIN